MREPQKDWEKDYRENLAKELDKWHKREEEIAARDKVNNEVETDKPQISENPSGSKSE